MVFRYHWLLVESWGIFWKTLKYLVVDLNFLSVWGIFDYNFWLTLSQVRVHLLWWPLISMCSTLWSIWFNTPNRRWKRLKSFSPILLFWLLVNAEICYTQLQGWSFILRWRGIKTTTNIFYISCHKVMLARTSLTSFDAKYFVWTKFSLFLLFSVLYRCHNDVTKSHSSGLVLIASRSIFDPDILNMS